MEWIRDNISHDTVEACEALLEAAKAGEIIGIAFACVLRKSRYITNAAGHCYRNPTFARGMLCSLSDELGAMIHHRDPDETR